MILTFANKETIKIWNGEISVKFPYDIQRNAKKKLIHIHSAINLNDLRVPPGNRLHSLKGKRKRKHSISINKQWRICFNWKDGNAYNVEITDYH